MKAIKAIKWSAYPKAVQEQRVEQSIQRDYLPFYYVAAFTVEYLISQRYTRMNNFRHGSFAERHVQPHGLTTGERFVRALRLLTLT